MISGRGLYEAYVEAMADQMVEVDEGWDDLDDSDRRAWNKVADRVNSKSESIG